MSTENPTGEQMEAARVLDWVSDELNTRLPEDLEIKLRRAKFLEKIPKDLYAKGLFTPYPVPEVK